MRPLARLAVLLLLLAACQVRTPAPGGETSPLPSDEIAVSALGAAPVAAATQVPANPASPAAKDTPAAQEPVVQVPGKTTPHPAERPQDLATPQPDLPKVPAEPAPPVSFEQALCEKSKGQWSPLGESSGHVCVHVTRDPGKSCHRKSDCQGECLAQSGTCSPIMPLMGCNDILQADGTEVTLCLQ